jgi:hypothetical protein
VAEWEQLRAGAFLNDDLALKPSVLNRVIDAIIRNGLVFQAEHQHMYDFRPMVWFIHLRGTGDPVRLARAAHSVLKATATPLPQASPAHPTTPFDKALLQRILHGYDAEVGDHGVVTVYVARRNPITISGIRVKPQTNIATNIAFEPLNHSGTRAAAVPDFGMEAAEINPWCAPCAPRVGTSAACTTRRPTSIRSSTSPTSSRPATPTGSRHKSGGGWTR